jgi:putative DNA primase/helicase
MDMFKGMQRVAKAEGLAKADKDRIRRLRSNARVKAVTELMQSTCFVSPDFFVENPDFLTVQNGIVDLRTRELLPHTKHSGSTKIARVAYRPGATHADWDAALTALDEEEASWFQVIMGQASTGHPPQEDRIFFMTGRAANGKSTTINGVTETLGDYVVHASDKALISNPWDHPTEKMQFRGARMVFIEELPAGQKITGKRLKDLTGRTMTARRIAMDNVTWTTTHTLLITTNHAVLFDSSGHSIERRIQIIAFGKQYRENPDLKAGELPIDRGLRSRIEQGETGQHEAVLAWIVEGAKRWYQNDKKIPQPPKKIRDDNKTWRADRDMVARFFSECISFDSDSHVTFPDLVASFNEYLKSNGLEVWPEEEFRVAFEAKTLLLRRRNRVARSRATAGRSRSPFSISHSVVAQPLCWFGMKFK